MSVEDKSHLLLSHLLNSRTSKKNGALVMGILLVAGWWNKRKKKPLHESEATREAAYLAARGFRLGLVVRDHRFVDECLQCA